MRCAYSLPDRTVWESQMLNDFRDNTPPTVEIGSGTKIGAAIAVVVAIGAIGFTALQYGGHTQLPVTAATAPAPSPVASAEQSTPAPDTTASAETPSTTDSAPQGYPLAATPPAATPSAATTAQK